ncbi:MAG: thioredoxin family protein [Egibacteraceae bacterium]
MSSIVEASRETFGELVGSGLVLVDVWGPACQPCLALAPHVEGIARDHPELAVVKLDATKARRVCIERRVLGLPTFLLFRDGEEVARISNPNLSVEELDAWLDKQLAQLRTEEE